MQDISDSDLRKRTQAVIDEVGLHCPEEQFRGGLWDAGLAVVQFPEGKGGLGLSPASQSAVESAIRDAGRDFNSLAINPIGIGMGLPTVLTYGSPEHHDKHLRRIYTGQDVWCQMFSEPTHGSDVAGLASRAIRDGDQWVVNGQKVWTSLAHRASYGMLLVRTDPDVPKHRGLSYFIIDMSAPGIDVRPLFQLTGDAEFNEVFLSDVRVPDSDRLGDVGDGWRVATTTLMNERVALGANTAPRGSGTISTLTDVWESQRHSLAPTAHTVLRDQVAQRWIEAEVLRLTTARARANASSGNPGPEGSVTKLGSAELNQRILNTAMEVVGASGLLHELGYPLERNQELQRRSSLTKSFLRAQANTIEGGTSEIMRNILGERVLGLPGDVRVDKGVAWRDIPT